MSGNPANPSLQETLTSHATTMLNPVPCLGGWFDWAYKGVDHSFPGNGGLECRDFLGLSQRYWESGVASLVAFAALVLSYPRLRLPPRSVPCDPCSPAPCKSRSSVAQVATTYEPVGKRVLLLLMCLTFGIELGFKFATRRMIWIGNPCHLATMMQIFILSAPPSRVVTAAFRLHMHMLTGAPIAILFPVINTRLLPFETGVYFLQHILMLIIPFYCLWLGDPYIPEKVGDFSWAMTSFGLLFVYHFIPLQILAYLSQVNLNNMLCPAVSDPFRGKFYRLFAIGHQLVLIPTLGKVFVLLARAFNFIARDSPEDCQHAVSVICREDDDADTTASIGSACCRPSPCNPCRPSCPSPCPSPSPCPPFYSSMCRPSCPTPCRTQCSSHRRSTSSRFGGGDSLSRSSGSSYSDAFCRCERCTRRREMLGSSRVRANFCSSNTAGIGGVNNGNDGSERAGSGGSESFAESISGDMDSAFGSGSNGSVGVKNMKKGEVRFKGDKNDDEEDDSGIVGVADSCERLVDEGNGVREGVGSFENEQTCCCCCLHYDTVEDKKEVRFYESRYGYNDQDHGDVKYMQRLSGTNNKSHTFNIVNGKMVDQAEDKESLGGVSLPRQNDSSSVGSKNGFETWPCDSEELHDLSGDLTNGKRGDIVVEGGPRRRVYDLGATSGQRFSKVNGGDGIGEEYFDYGKLRSKVH